MAGVAELLGKAQRWAVPAAQVHAVAKKKKKVGHAGGGDDDDDVDSGASGSSGSSGDDSGDDGEDEEDGHRRSRERSSGGASQGPCHRTQRPGGSESGGRIDGGHKDSSAAAAAAAAARRFEALQDAWARHLLPGTQTPCPAPAVPSMPRVAEEGAVVEASKEKAAGSAGAAAALAAGASVALVGPVAALAAAVDTAGAAPRARSHPLFGAVVAELRALTGTAAAAAATTGATGAGAASTASPVTAGAGEAGVSSPGAGGGGRPGVWLGRDTLLALLGAAAEAHHPSLFERRFGTGRFGRLLESADTVRTGPGGGGSSSRLQRGLRLVAGGEGSGDGGGDASDGSGSSSVVGGGGRSGGSDEVMSWTAPPLTHAMEGAVAAALAEASGAAFAVVNRDTLADVLAAAARAMASEDAGAAGSMEGAGASVAAVRAASESPNAPDFKGFEGTSEGEVEDGDEARGEAVEALFELIARRGGPAVVFVADRASSLARPAAKDRGSSSGSICCQRRRRDGGGGGVIDGGGGVVGFGKSAGEESTAVSAALSAECRRVGSRCLLVLSSVEDLAAKPVTAVAAAEQEEEDVEEKGVEKVKVGDAMDAAPRMPRWTDGDSATDDDENENGTVGKGKDGEVREKEKREENEAREPRRLLWVHGNGNGAAEAGVSRGLPAVPQEVARVLAKLGETLSEAVSEAQAEAQAAEEVVKGASGGSAEAAESGYGGSSPSSSSSSFSSSSSSSSSSSKSSSSSPPPSSSKSREEALASAYPGAINLLQRAFGDDALARSLAARLQGALAASVRDGGPVSVQLILQQHAPPPGAAAEQAMEEAVEAAVAEAAVAEGALQCGDEGDEGGEGGNLAGLLSWLDGFLKRAASERDRNAAGSSSGRRPRNAFAARFEELDAMRRHGEGAGQGSHGGGHGNGNGRVGEGGSGGGSFESSVRHIAVELPRDMQLKRRWERWIDEEKR